jgi:hypothetical protein
MYVVIHYRFQLQIIVEYKYENVNYFDGKCNGLVVNNVDLFPTPILSKGITRKFQNTKNALILD